MIQVLKRNCTVVDFDPSKIKSAISRCFADVNEAITTEALARLTNTVVNNVKADTQSNTPISVEEIQTIVEITLMRRGYHKAARHYVLFREERAKQRTEQPISDEVQQAFDADQEFFNSDLEIFQHYDKYARFNEALGRRETYRETVGRVMEYLRWAVDSKFVDARVNEAEFEELEQALLYNQASTSMRLMQMAGPAAKRCNMCIYNCSWIVIDRISAFTEALYVLMQGTGLGFSVESEFIEDLPRVYKRTKIPPEHFVVEDTTESWCDSLQFGLENWFKGRDVIFDYSKIRPAGARLRTKSGTASGYEALQRLHDFVRKTIFSRAGKRLRPIDVHDIMCMIGYIVQVGGVRRAACISLSDLDDSDMRTAKFGAYFNDPDKKIRSMANNSAVYDDKPNMHLFLDEWSSLVKSYSGERGIFNRNGNIKRAPKRRSARLKAVNGFGPAGTNPCGEIVFLSPTRVGLCNLSIAIVRPDDTEETLREKVRLAAIFGTIQSGLTDFNYVSGRWKESAELERLLGVDLLGALDCPLLRADNPDRDALLGRLRDVAIETNCTWANKLGIRESVAVTCIKPGGNSGARYGTGQSMSGWLTQYMIRNTEVSHANPLYHLLADAGVPHEVSYRDPNTSVFSWPLCAPEGAMVVSDLQLSGDTPIGIKPRRSAIHQLNDWLSFQRHWAEHSVSVTIYVADDEWLAVGDWVLKHWDDISGLSFLPLSGGIYKQAPFTPCTKQYYDEFVARFPKINWAKLTRYEKEDSTKTGQELACVGGACSL